MVATPRQCTATSINVIYSCTLVECNVLHLIYNVADGSSFASLLGGSCHMALLLALAVASATARVRFFLATCCSADSGKSGGCGPPDIIQSGPGSRTADSTCRGSHPSARDPQLASRTAFGCFAPSTYPRAPSVSYPSNACSASGSSRATSDGTDMY